MRNISFIILLIILSPAASYSQILKGNITNTSGEPIQYATVYISELRQGTTANTKGDYALRLPEGHYTVTFQSLGYEAINLEITITKDTVKKDVSLPLQYYQVPEVRITASGEDPAYIIMRKVIGMAPYYLNNISYYKAEVYLKGNLVVNKIPKILERSMKRQEKKGEEIPFREGDSFFMESYNEIEFTAPDKYFQKVLSLNSTFPEEGNEISPMSFIQASFYEPDIADMAISPLSPAAFSHYNFKYIGLGMQGDYAINKIQVIPKRKSQQLFEGTIFIIEDLWCLHSVDLVNENLAGRVRVQQLYIPGHDGVWLPVSHKFDVNISVIGVRADAFYGSSVKYLEVKPNLNLKKPETITTNISPKAARPDTLPVAKTEEQINKILSKDELSNRDMVRLSKLMEKKTEKSLSDTVRKSREITENITHEIEKGANKKDSSYWAQIRPIPLSEIEKKALVISDSTKKNSEMREMKKDSLTQREPGKKNRFVKTLRNVATGYTWRDTVGTSLRFGGLAGIKNFSFNTVDGFVYGLDFGFTKTGKGGTFSLSPQLKWAFGREDLIWKINSFYRFGGQRFNQLYLRLGQASTDFNNGGGINIFLNTSLSLFLRKNHLKLYESGYVTLGYTTDIALGLNLDVSATWEDRSMLGNSSDFSFFRTSEPYSENFPVNEFLEPDAYPFYAIRDMRHAALLTTVTWTPFQKYKVVNKRKIPQGSDWPTFQFTWRHGLNEFRGLPAPVKSYDMLRFEASKVANLAAFTEFRWRIRTGGFLNNRNVTFYDFYHVNSQPLPLLLNTYGDAFRLPAFYSLSTPEFFVQAHTRYTTPYLLLKLLPGLSNTLMRENLSLSYMGSAGRSHYTEVGYSVSEIFFLLELGVHVGFEDLNYKSAGISLVLKIN